MTEGFIEAADRAGPIAWQRAAAARRVAGVVIDKGYEARIATDEATMLDAWRLRYRSYHEQGFIETRPDGIFRDRYDDMPNATTVVVYDSGRAIGSVRACLLRRGGPFTSPARDSYRAEVDAAMAECGPERDGWDGLEVNRMVRAPEAADDQGLAFLLLRLSGRLAMAAQFRFVVSCVRRNHVPFYRRMSFTTRGEARIYPGLTCPMVLLHSSRTAWDTMRARFPLMDPEAGPEGSLEGLEHGRTVRPHIVRRG